MTNSIIPQYMAHDFSAVNRYVDSVATAADDRMRGHRAERFAVYAKYLGATVIALGASVLMVLFGLSLLKEPRVVTETKIVEKPVVVQPNIYVTQPEPLQAARGAAEARITESASAAGVSASVYDFVIFRDIPFSEGEIGPVRVGMRYENSESKDPSFQWCYVRKDTSNLPGYGETIWLANKAGNDIRSTTIRAEHARALGVSASTLRRAQRLCQFR